MKQGWEVKKLGEVCEKASSNIALNKITEEKGIYPLYGASGLVQTISFYQRNSEYIGIIKDGSGVGRVGIYPPYSSLLGTMQYILPKDIVIIKFLYYALCNIDLSKYAAGAAIPHIYFRDYCKELLFIPPLAEQERIVAELDLLSSIIEKKKAQLTALDTLCQSIFYEMFGDPIINEKGWEEVKLGNVCRISSSKRVLVQDVVNEGIPFIRGTELALLSKQTSFDSKIFTMFITPEHYEKVKAITGVPSIHDILIPSINPDGYVWEVNTSNPFYFKDGRVIWVHTNHNKFSSAWLKFSLSQFIVAKYNNLSRGAVFTEITLMFLRDMEIILPPLQLQQAFADKITAIERQKSLIRQSLTETQTLFNSRMSFYFD